MTNESYRIEKQVTLRAPRSRVWSALTDVTEVQQWVGMVLESPFAPGAVVRGHSKDPEWAHLPFEVVIETMEPEHTLSWRWHPGMPQPGEDRSMEPMTLVVFTLVEVPDGTLLRVVETGFEAIPEARREGDFEMNTQGWAMQLENIRRYVEEGATA